MTNFNSTLLKECLQELPLKDIFLPICELAKKDNFVSKSQIEGIDFDQIKEYLTKGRSTPKSVDWLILDKKIFFCELKSLTNKSEYQVLLNQDEFKRNKNKIWKEHQIICEKLKKEKPFFDNSEEFELTFEKFIHYKIQHFEFDKKYSDSFKLLIQLTAQSQNQNQQDLLNWIVNFVKNEKQWIEYIVIVDVKNEFLENSLPIFKGLSFKHIKDIDSLFLSHEPPLF